MMGKKIASGLSHKAGARSQPSGGGGSTTPSRTGSGSSSKHQPTAADQAAAAEGAESHHHQHHHHHHHHNSVHSGDGAPVLPLTIAHIKEHENYKLLPRYSAALGRPHDDSLPPEDLDGIQMELEQLLSTVARRSHALRHESLLLERGTAATAAAAGEEQLAGGGVTGATSQTGVGGRRSEAKRTGKGELLLAVGEKPPISPGKRKRGAAGAATHTAATSSSEGGGGGDRKKDKYYGGGGSGQRKVAKVKASASPTMQQHHHTSSSGHGAHHQPQQQQPMTSQHHPHGGGAASTDDNVDGGGGGGYSLPPPTAEHSPKMSAMPKNDVPNKFWLSVEPYCMPISHEDIKLLDDLIGEYAAPLVPAVPDLGPHYSQTWALEDLRDEQDGSNANAKANRRFTSAVGGTAAGGGGGGAAEVMGLLRKGEKLMGDQVTGPLTQRLMAAFIEENVIGTADTTPPAASAPSATDAVPQMARNGVSLERRVRQELIEQGLLSADDFGDDGTGDETAGRAATATVAEDDEILGEIMRVRTELATIAEYNYTELQKLHAQAKSEMQRLDVKRQLDVVDQEIVEMYKRVAQIKQSKQPKRRRLTENERSEVFRLTEEQKRLSDLLETFNR